MEHLTRVYRWSTWRQEKKCNENCCSRPLAHCPPPFWWCHRFAIEKVHIAKFQRCKTTLTRLSATTGLSSPHTKLPISFTCSRVMTIIRSWSSGRSSAWTAQTDSLVVITCRNLTILRISGMHGKRAFNWNRASRHFRLQFPSLTAVI